MRGVTWAVGVTMMIGVTALCAAATSGPDQGTSPMLTIKPANRDGDAYCLTCKAGMNPAVVVFATRNDEPTQKLLLALDEQAKAGAAKKLNAVAVFVGPSDVSNALVAYAKDQKVSYPVAIVAADSAALKPWKLNADVSSTTVLLKSHKVDHSVADLPADKLAEQVGALLVSPAPHSGGGSHHG